MALSLGYGDSARPPRQGSVRPRLRVPAQALHQQGVLLAPPRLVDGEELPEDHPLSPANIAQMRGSVLDPVTKFLPSKERS